MNTHFKTPAGTQLPLMDMRGKPYLQVANRLVWFREEHPSWGIETELLAATATSATARATIRDETGRIRATAHKSEEKQHFADFAEKAETGAVGRALAMVGYGTQFAPDLDEDERIVDSPTARQKAGGAQKPPGKPAAPSPRPSGTTSAQPSQSPKAGPKPKPSASTTSGASGAGASPGPSLEEAGAKGVPAKEPAKGPPREVILKQLLALHKPFLDKNPTVNFVQLLTARYGVPETKLMTYEQIQDLVVYLERALGPGKPAPALAGGRSEPKATPKERAALVPLLARRKWTLEQGAEYMRIAFGVSTSAELTKPQLSALISVIEAATFDVAMSEITEGAQQ